MRIIQFRAKDTNDKWLYGSILINYYDRLCDSIVSAYIEGTDIYRIGEQCWRPELVNYDTIGQFTGLCDKKGNAIYEGDILDFNGLIIEVRFVRGVFALLCDGDLDHEICGDCRTDLFATVIGNIHDNPELLKGGEK